MKNRIVELLFVVLAVGLLGNEVSGRVITVPSDYATIQAAIDAAANGDEIVVLPWVYQESVNFRGKNIVLRSTDPTSSSVVANTVIQGGWEGPTVAFSGTESSSCVLAGFTITGGFASGIAGHGTLATIQHNVVTTNSANWGSYSPGGGLNGCNGLIQFNRITNNIARFGGGLYDCNGTIQFNVITFNSVLGGYLGPRGEGAGLANCNGTIANNVIAFNSNQAHCGAGGGLYNCNGAILYNTIYGNSAPTDPYFPGQGGGLYRCRGFVANCIVWANTANGVSSQLEGCAPPFYSCIQDWPTTSGVNNIASDPLFVDPSHGDFHLQPGSPCIDHGFMYYLGGTYFADLDGQFRLAGASVDIGCDETGSASDRDGDLLSDGSEAARGTDPTKSDTDGDGLMDGVEVLRGTNPLVPNVWSGISVPSQVATIQQAVFLACPTETITVSPGTYHANLFFLGKNLTLQSTNPSDGSIVDGTVIDGGGVGSVILLDCTVRLGAVRGFTIQNGSAPFGGCIHGGGSFATIENNKIVGGRADYGGGIQGCNGTIRYNTISGNSAANGGGLYACDGTVENNTISSNSAIEYGGGFSSCAGSIRNNTISENSAQYGGGLYGCTALIEDNVITKNSAEQGGGLCRCDALIRGNTISNNSAHPWGGGVLFCNGVIENNQITGNSAEGATGGLGGCDGTIRNNVISNNTAPDGAGVNKCGGAILNNIISGNSAGNSGGGVAECYGTVQNNLIYSNSAGLYGGGLYGCSGRVENDTVYGNTASNGGGLYGCTGAIGNCIVWGNAAPSNPEIFASSIPSYSCIQDWALGGTGNITLDPRLANPAAGDFHLLADSPCIDAGGAVAGLNEDFEGDYRPYKAVAESRGDGSGYDIGADEYLPAAGLPNIHFLSSDFGPSAPVLVKPGDTIALNAVLENNGGTPTGPFWLEFWGSRTGGLMLDQFLGDSVGISPLGPGARYPFAAAKLLYSIPDGPYTVVFSADRPNQVAESDEGDNHSIVRSKKLVVIRPQTNVDLVVENFTIDVFQHSQPTGQVRNLGTQHSGPFWIEFWGALPANPYPALEFFLCDSIYVTNLAPGGVVQLADYPGSAQLWITPAWVGCFVDRPDNINELDETNNYQFYRWGSSLASPEESVLAAAQEGRAGKYPPGYPDLVITSADVSPAAPVQSKPGDLISVSITIANLGAADAGPFWLEFWGSQLGGFNYDTLLLDRSERLAGLAAGQSRTLTLTKPLLGVPDRPWTVVAWVDRLQEVYEESSESNNRYAVPRKRVLVIRPSTGANLVLENFAVEPDTLRPGQEMRLGGTVRNAGTGNSGPFWIEFWASLEQLYPTLDFMLCDSIGVPNLAPGQEVRLSDYPRTLYGPQRIPQGTFAIGCFVDRVDSVNETDESDNYVFLRDRLIFP